MNQNINGETMSSSSSDSDAGERIKNVQLFLVKSQSGQEETNENHAYKQKLGDLIFDANYEGANLGYVEQVDLYEYDLMVRPDIANPRYRLWFNFTVLNQQPNQCVIFTFVNLSDDLRLLHEGLTPVVRSRLNPKWTRLHEDQVFYYKSSNHGDRYVLSLAFRFSNYDNEHQFALFYPYTHTSLINFVSRWTVELKRIGVSRRLRQNNLLCQQENRRSPELNIGRRSPKSPSKSGFRSPGTYSPTGPTTKGGRSCNESVDFKVEVLAKTILSKSLYQLSIKEFNSDQTLPVVIVLCRYCGNIDSVASLVCQGFIDFLLSDQPMTREARQCMDVVVFPMMDPDSICAGNSRTDIMGQQKISPKILESNKCIYANFARISEFLEKTCSQIKRRVVIIELGVSLNLIGSKISGSYYQESLRMERHLSFPRLMARFADDFYMENCDFSKGDIVPSLLCKFGTESNVDKYRLEVSPFAFYKRCLTERSYEEYDQIKYLAIGKAMVYALFELLRPKEKVLPESVMSILDAFHPKSGDIDNLILNFDDVVKAS